MAKCLWLGLFHKLIQSQYNQRGFIPVKHVFMQHNNELKHASSLKVVSQGEQK